MARAKVEPLSENEKKGWDELIAETKVVVARHDASVFDLVLLAGRVEAKYGEGRLKRWADEAGVGYQSAKQYRWLAGKGVDEAFIEKYAGKLSFSVIREIAGFTGSVNNKYAIEYLEYAIEHRLSAIAIQGYMLQDTAPHEGKNAAAESLKLAFKTKQEKENFSDQMRDALEKLVEENPHLEGAILNTVITSEKDLDALKIAAGVMNQAEEKLISDSKKALDKLKRFRQWIAYNQDLLNDGISYGHPHSQELKHYANMVGELLIKVGETQLADLGDVQAEPLALPQ